MLRNATIVRLVRVCVLGIGLALGAVGCASVGPDPTVTVRPQYTDLSSKTVAVLVTADRVILTRFPYAARNVTRAVTREIALNVEEVRVVDPKRVLDYQDDNPAWSTLPPGDLVRAMEVDRLILVELAEYRTHEPGNPHVKLGTVSGTVDLYEAEALDPNQKVLTTPITVQFPRTAKTKVGLVGTDDKTIEAGMLKDFSLRAGGVFFEHEVPLP